MAIRLLGEGDEAVVAVLAERAPDFEEDPGSEPRPPLGEEEARALLADDASLYWVAEEDGEVVGYLFAVVHRRRYGEAREVLIYDIGTRRDRRRRGVATGLVQALEGWMADNGCADIWLVADAAAIAFYEACGFEASPDQGTVMGKRAVAPRAPDENSE